MRFVLPLVIVLGGMGCGTLSTAQKVALGGDAFVCAADDATNVEQAIRSGGADWLGVVTGLFQCIPQVIRDIQAKEAASSAVASTADTVIPPKLSKGAKRRMATARIFGELLNNSVTR